MTTRTIAAAAALFALAIAAAPAPRALAADAACTLTAREGKVAADAQQKWPVGLTVHNGGTYGLYLDSLAMVTTPLTGPHAGQSRRERLHFSIATDAVSAGDDHAFDLHLPASHDSTKLELQVYGHTREVPLVLLTATVLAGGYDPDVFFPSTLVRVGGRTVELVRVAANADAAAGAGVLLLPEEGSDGIAEFQTARSLSALGYATVIVKPPGTGRSQGPADLAGPASLAGAAAALDSLAHQPGVDPARLAAWGTGTGGTLAVLLAAKHPELKAVIAQSAPFDAWAAYRALPEASRKAYAAEAGRDSAAWRARSPLSAPPRLACAVLVLHGERDAVAPAAGAHAFVAALLAQSVVVDGHFDASAGHVLAATTAFRLGQNFVKAHTSTP